MVRSKGETDQNTMDVILFKLGEKDRISLSALDNAIRNVRRLLASYDAMLANDPRGNLRWEVEILQKASPPSLGVSPQIIKRRDTPPPPVGYAEDFEKQLVRGLTSFSAPVLVGPAIQSHVVLRDIERLAVQSTVIGPIQVSINGHSVAINETTLKNVRELTAKKYEGIGSVLGRLEAISVHSGNEIRVWDENTSRPVVCNYPAELEDKIKANLRKRVLVSGTVSYNASGQPLSCAVEDIDPYPESDELPTIEQVSGLIDDLRGGLSMRDYIERLRDE
jgi:hypothetical protein